jgi:hypothetical protein
MKTIINYATNLQTAIFSDPEQDPYVFWPPGSRAVIIYTDPDPDPSIS